MKKFSWIFALILALSIVFVFAGCGEEPSNPGVNDGSGPSVRFSFSSLEIPAGAQTNTSLAPFGLKISGNADVSSVGGVLIIDPSAVGTAGTENHHALDILASAYEDIEPPFELTVKGTALQAGTLKFGQPESPWGNIKVGTAMLTDDEFELTATVTATNITGQSGIRILSNSAASISFAVTSIKIVK